MAIKIGSNFTFQGEQPNFERDRFATKADMKAFPETSIDDGHLSYCMEDKNTYQFKSSNSVDATTGKWRLFKADVVLDDTVSTTSDNGVKNSVITKYVDGKITTINSSITDIRTSLESTQTDFVDLRNKVNAMPKTVFITQAAYDALSSKDANTIYYING